METHEVIIDNKKTLYVEYNKELPDTVLLLHGLGGDHHGLINVSSFLKNKRVIILDLPGHGLSQVLNTDITLENYAHFINSFCEYLNIKKFTLIGHSFGGAIAFMYSKLYGKNLIKLILLTPVLKEDGSILVKLSRIYMDIIKHLPDNIFKFLVSNKLIIYFTDRIVMTKEGKMYRKEILTQDYLNYKRMDIKTIKNSTHALNDIHINDYINNQNMPIFIILGNKDPLVKNTDIYQIEHLLKHIHISILNGGHLLPQENPKKVGPIINQFINN